MKRIRWLTLPVREARAKGLPLALEFPERDDVDAWRYALAEAGDVGCLSRTGPRKFVPNKNAVRGRFECSELFSERQSRFNTFFDLCLHHIHISGLGEGALRTLVSKNLHGIQSPRPNTAPSPQRPWRPSSPTNYGPLPVRDFLRPLSPDSRPASSPEPRSPVCARDSRPATSPEQCRRIRDSRPASPGQFLLEKSSRRSPDLLVPVKTSRPSTSRSQVKFSRISPHSISDLSQLASPQSKWRNAAPNNKRKDYSRPSTSTSCPKLAISSQDAQLTDFG